MIKVILCDDHPLVREGIKDILESNFNELHVVAETGNASDLLKIVKDQDADLVILEIALPDHNGLVALRRIKQMDKSLPVLVFTMHEESRYALEALRAGASGYILKEGTPQEIIKAVQHIVFQDRKYITPEISAKLADIIERHSVKPLFEELSKREYQVASLFASGKSVNEISKELDLSPRTIYTYRSRMFKKLNIHSDVDFTHFMFSQKVTQEM